MKLSNIAIPTQVVRAGMTLRQAFDICVLCNVPGVPFVDDRGHIIGRVSIRDSLKKTCIPEYLIKAAHMLGDDLGDVTIPEVHAREVLSHHVEHYMLESTNTVSSESPIIKGLAIMEQNGTDYLFLVDDGQYKGVVTRMGIAQRIVEAVPDNELL